MSEPDTESLAAEVARDFASWLCPGTARPKPAKRQYKRKVTPRSAKLSVRVGDAEYLRQQFAKDRPTPRRCRPKRFRPNTHDPYLQGVDAKIAGGAIEDNPHAGGTESHELWVQGFADEQ